VKLRLRTLLDEFLPDAAAIERRRPAEGSRVTLYALCALIVTALAWATLSEVDRVVASRGRLVTPLPNIVVQPLEPGVLKSIEVRVGQVVHKGDVLATLDATFTAADVAQLSIRAETLSARTRRLELELGGKAGSRATGADDKLRTEAALLAERRANYEARLRQYDETIAKFRAARETNLQDQRTLGERLKSLTELEGMYRKLEADKFGSRALVLAAADKRLEVERDYTVARNREEEIQREIAAAEAERTAFVRGWRQKAEEELSELRQQRDEASQQLMKARRREQLVRLTSPENAVVLELGKKSVGSVLKEGEPLFALVPIDAALEAEVEVSPADVGDLRVGDPVRIKVDAYPFQKHGTLEGKLITVGADALSRPASGTDTYYYYVARVALPSTQLKQLPESARLLPGMTVAGELIVGRRSVISYFLYPVIRILDESIRER
jgi:HlyD family secretion protein